MKFNMDNKESTYISFYRGSLNYFKAIDIIINSNEDCPSDVSGFLVSHCLELSLKAFLLSKGLDESRVIKIGHNLNDAWNKAVENGLPIDSSLFSWCDKLNSAHNRPFLFRYARTNTGLVTPSFKTSHFNLNKILDIVGQILKLDRKGDFLEI